jgi:small subunit ribosomal protein S8
MKQALIKVFYDEGYVGPFRVVEEEGRKKIQVKSPLHGQEAGDSVALRKDQQPGLRVYMGYKDLKPVRSGWERLSCRPQKES